MLILTGYIHLAPSDVGAFTSDMAAFARAARARDGCLFFAVAPEDGEAGRILVAERWRDQAALTAHLSAENTMAFVSRWRHRMTGEIAKFDVFNERALDAD